jgi:hypothetical protein
MQCGRTIRDFKTESSLVSHGLCVQCGAEFAREIDSIELEQVSCFEYAPFAIAAAR